MKLKHKFLKYSNWVCNSDFQSMKIVSEYFHISVATHIFDSFQIDLE